MTDSLRATVVGGGIAGLAAATALTHAGWRVTVLERATRFGEVGAGLAIAGNGMAALDALGAGDAVRAAGHRSLGAAVQDPTGRWLARLPDDPAGLWAIHRQRLHDALLRVAGDADLVTDARVTAVDPGVPGAEPATVTWRTGDRDTTVTCDLVVAADGVRSAVRAGLFPQARTEYSGYTSWRAVITDTDRVDDRFVTVWGPRIEFGTLRLSPTEVYWYGYFRHPAGATLDDELGTARTMFGDWSPRVRDTVAATTADQLMRHDVHHLPDGAPAYTSGRTVLIGDAAHAMLPTMGQGANSALEDGICVGRLVGRPVADGGDLAVALAGFDRTRRPRCRRIARDSEVAARVGPDLPAGWRQRLRDTIMPRLPARAVGSAGTRIVRWSPP